MDEKARQLRADAVAAARASLDIIEKTRTEGHGDLTEAERLSILAAVERGQKKHRDYLDHLNSEEVRQAAEQKRKAAEQEALIDRLAGSGKYASKAVGYVPSKWASDVLDSMQRVTGQLGLKNLLAGEVRVPAVIDVLELPDVPTRLLDLIPRETLDSQTFSFLREVVKTNRAAVVADGQRKPTSSYTFQEEEDRARVVAHLSEPFPIRYLSDYAELARILDTQLRAGVLEGLEAEVVGGSGDGEHFLGLLSADGVLGVDFTTDRLTTCRKALTRLELLGETPTAWAINPADIEAIELTQDLNDRFLGQGPFQSGPGTLWGLPRVPCLGVAAGTAILGDWQQSKLLVREGVSTLTATQATITVNGSQVNLWETNQCCVRTEGRFGFYARRPQAFALVSLEEGS